MPNFRELLQLAKSEIVEVTTEEAENLIEEGWLLLDVREPDEYEHGVQEEQRQEGFGREPREDALGKYVPVGAVPGM